MRCGIQEIFGRLSIENDGDYAGLGNRDVVGEELQDFSVS